MGGWGGGGGQEEEYIQNRAREVFLWDLKHVRRFATKWTDTLSHDAGFSQAPVFVRVVICAGLAL